MGFLYRLSLFAFLTSMLIGQECSVTVLVILSRASIDSTAHCYIAGNTPALGNWHPRAVPLKKINDSVWSYSGTARRGEILQWKITSGSWEGEAIYDTNAVPQNTVVEITKDTTVTLRPISWKNHIARSQPVRTIKGTVAYHRQLRGEGLNFLRDIIVWLPPSYAANTAKRYPVLYMHDGQNIFDPSTAFTGYDWRVDEVADSLIRLKMMEEIIVVGIANSPDRLAEYSDSPLGTAYRNFVINVVKPLIDSTYRTKPDRRHTAVMGSSLGGLCSFLFVWKRPDIFGNAGCLSTSFWYDGKKTLKEVRDFSGRRKAIRLYLDCGQKEKDLIGDYRRMIETLKKQGFKKGMDLDYYVDPNGVHNEQAWSKRVWRPLMFLYGKGKK